MIYVFKINEGMSKSRRKKNSIQGYVFSCIRNIVIQYLYFRKMKDNKFFDFQIFSDFFELRNCIFIYYLIVY